jgi:hypothetical protein
VILLALIPYLSWRWFKSIQSFVFPYLGGHWSGELKFDGKDGPETRAAALEIRHSILSIELILESLESTSRTVVVYAQRDKGINRDRLYYTYLNERKEGVAGAGERYYGLAILRAEASGCPTLYGDYFTEHHRNGTLHLTRTQTRPWWHVWE